MNLKTIEFLNEFPGPGPNPGRQLASMNVSVNAASLVVLLGVASARLATSMDPRKREVLKESVIQIQSQLESALEN